MERRNGNEVSSFFWCVAGACAMRGPSSFTPSITPRRRSQIEAPLQLNLSWLLLSERRERSETTGNWILPSLNRVHQTPRKSGPLIPFPPPQLFYIYLENAVKLACNWKADPVSSPSDPCIVSWWENRTRAHLLQEPFCWLIRRLPGSYLCYSMEEVDLALVLCSLYTSIRVYIYGYQEYCQSAWLLTQTLLVGMNYEQDAKDPMSSGLVDSKQLRHLIAEEDRPVRIHDQGFTLVS